jgi:hypothetical protein
MVCGFRSHRLQKSSTTDSSAWQWMRAFLSTAPGASPGQLVVQHGLVCDCAANAVLQDRTGVAL